MEEIAISKFKATCLAVLKRVRSTRTAIRVTKFGEPVAEIVPPTPAPRKAGWLGSLKHTGKIHDDIITPAGDESDWEAGR